MALNVAKYFSALVLMMLMLGCSSSPNRSVLMFGATIVEKQELRGSFEGVYTDTIVINEDTRQVKYSDRITMELEECSDSGWYCISDGNIEFSIPKRLGTDLGAWSRRGIDYSIVGTQAIEGRGINSASVFFVRAVRKGRTMEEKIYTYSSKKGLIGITVPQRDVSDRMIVVSYIRLN